MKTVSECATVPMGVCMCVWGNQPKSYGMELDGNGEPDPRPMW